MHATIPALVGSSYPQAQRFAGDEANLYLGWPAPVFNLICL